MKFKKGDKVVCIDMRFNYAEVEFSNKPVVTVDYYVDPQMLKIKECSHPDYIWSEDRFRLATLLERELAE